MKEKNSNTTLIPTNLDTPDINLAQANNERNNQTEYQQNNLKEAIKNKNTTKRRNSEEKLNIKNLNYFEGDVHWWQENIQYGNTKIQRFKLTPYILLPLTNKSERDWFYETDEKWRIYTLPERRPTGST